MPTESSGSCYFLLAVRRIFSRAYSFSNTFRRVISNSPRQVLCTAKTVQVPPTPATGVTLPAPGTTTTVLPSTTPASLPTPVANVAPIKSSPSPTANNNNNNDGNDDKTDDDDDDDLPFCDEI